jgi:hypothetical protein
VIHIVFSSLNPSVVGIMKAYRCQFKQFISTRSRNSAIPGRSARIAPLFRTWELRKTL